MYHLLSLCLVFAAVLCVLGMRLMTRPSALRRGSMMMGIGMLLAVVATLADPRIDGYFAILLGLILGGLAGVGLAREMSGTPSHALLAILRSLPAAACCLVAQAEFTRWKILATAAGQTAADIVPALKRSAAPFPLPLDVLSAIAACSLLSGLALGCGLMLHAQAAGWPVHTQVQQLPQRSSMLIALSAMLLLSLWGVMGAESQFAGWLIVGLSVLLGALLVAPATATAPSIVWAALNLWTGLAVAAMGFLISSQLLIVLGAAVGSAHLWLARTMAAEQHATLASIFGLTRPVLKDPTHAVVQASRTISAVEVAQLLGIAKCVVIVPGAGLAAVQAQHALSELVSLLQSRGCEVLIGVHPLAGHAPGQMTHLLAAANVAESLWRNVDDINLALPQTDVCLVVGASDIVNEAARTRIGSSLHGVLMIQPELARACVVIKRSTSPGVSGEKNPLFELENVSLLADEAESALEQILWAMKSASAEMGTR